MVFWFYFRFHDQQTFSSTGNELSVYFKRVSSSSAQHLEGGEYVDGAFSFTDGEFPDRKCDRLSKSIIFIESPSNELCFRAQNTPKVLYDRTRYATSRTTDAPARLWVAYIITARSIYFGMSKALYVALNVSCRPLTKVLSLR